MKKKIILALLLVAIFTCMFALAVSAVTTSSSYAISFDVLFSGDTEYTTIYTANTDNDNPRVYFNNGFYKTATYDESTKKFTFTDEVDNSQIVKIDFSKAVTIKSRGTVVKGTGKADTPLTNCQEVKWFTAEGSTSQILQSFFQDWTALKSFDFGCTTIIDVSSFKNTGFETLVIPATVTWIKNGAFENCVNLKTLTIEGTLPNGVGTNMFAGCSNLETATMNNLGTLGVRMFQNCTSLTTVVAPNATVIKEEAFGKTCTALETITLTWSSITSIEQYAFQSLTCIPENLDLANVTSIGSSAFNSCTDLTTVNMPKVKTIGSKVFYGCTDLTSVTTTSELTSISDEAFRNCTALTGTIDFTNVTSLRDNVFNGCTLIQFGDVNLSNVTYFGNGVFYKCEGLTSIIIPDGITALGGFGGCTSLKTVSLPASLQKLNGNCFEGCTALENVIFRYDYETYPEYGSAFTTVGNGSVFKNCTSLKSLVFPNSLTGIYNNAFSGCTSLTNLVLGASFTFADQCPAIPNKLTSLVLSETYNSNSMPFSWSKDKFTCPTTLVIYYTGTKAQAEALQEVNTYCWEVSHSTLVSYEEFTSKDFVRDDTVHYMVYNYNKCEAFYGGIHNVVSEEGNTCSGTCNRTGCGMFAIKENPIHTPTAPILAYGVDIDGDGIDDEYTTVLNYYANMYVRHVCEYCPTETEKSEKYGSIFEKMGYSAAEYDTTAISFFTSVNHKALEKYEEMAETELQYGLVISAAPSDAPITGLVDGKLQLASSTVSVSMTGTEYTKFSVKITGLPTEQALNCCGYVVNGTSVTYLGHNKTSDKAETIDHAKAIAYMNGTINNGSGTETPAA